ncbi:phosphotransferase enzyme family protein [Paenibacillus methanolicus]|uniref:Ser/Thr protein kinase RdoA (MazF antagonist) n=1 Tax=Paenibacillus methanolicus TaxID=582686 RepID=A0A5S5C942_9BACL|nr:phosphotransferase [Paenibacillus methanolicus]TYP74503.1 Ser/Thr protein kinase RdoA (MazF antagonist) [Paenibacillus methanolicus]
MNSGFQIETDASRRQTLAEARQAALHAVRQYELEWNEIRFVQVSEHVTFRIAAGEGDSYLLRIHPGSKPRPEIASELEWLTALKRKGLAIPEAVANRDGAYVTTASTCGGQQLHATVLTWIEGEHRGSGALTEETTRKMGALMAELHEASADFSPSPSFSRPAWGLESFRRDWAHLRRHHRHFISEEAMTLYARAADQVEATLAALSGHDRNYGMIHADLHIGNVVFRDDEPYPIDFGRCGYGYHHYDMAQAIMGMPPAQRASFVAGYEEARPLEQEAISKLESFFIMAMIESYSFHAENPLETEGLIEEQPYAEALLRAYVNGAPFLFESLG